MLLLLTFIGSAIAPMSGLVGGMLPCWNGVTSRATACLYGGVLASTIGALVGSVIALTVCNETAGGAEQVVLQSLGGVNAIIWCGWVSFVVAGAVGIYAAATSVAD